MLARRIKISNPKVVDKVDDDIVKYGAHVLSVTREDSQNFSYTIGFEETLNHPEIIMSGLRTELMYHLLNEYW